MTTLRERDPDGARGDRPMGTGRRIGLGFVFLWFFVGGVAHFAAADLEARIVPPFVPWPYAAVYASGVLELVGALGLLSSRTRRAAGWLLFALTIAVTPANIYMLQTADRWPVPTWLLVARLPLQVALLALIWWSTAPAARGPSHDDRR